MESRPRVEGARGGGGQRPRRGVRLCSRAKEDYLVLVRAGDLLEPHALLGVRRNGERDEAPELMYVDEGVLHAHDMLLRLVKRLNHPSRSSSYSSRCSNRVSPWRAKLSSRIGPFSSAGYCWSTTTAVRGSCAPGFPGRPRLPRTARRRSPHQFGRRDLHVDRGASSSGR